MRRSCRSVFSEGVSCQMNLLGGGCCQHDIPVLLEKGRCKFLSSKIVCGGKAAEVPHRWPMKNVLSPLGGEGKLAEGLLN